MFAFTIRSKHILSITFLFVVALFCFIQGSKTYAFDEGSKTYAFDERVVPETEPLKLDYSLLDIDTIIAGPCGSRLNSDLTDYHTVQMDDGYRWEYQLLPPTAQNTVVFQLHIEFLCTDADNNNKIGVLAVYDEPWHCSGTPIIRNGGYDFNGSNGFDCTGLSLKVVVEKLLTHLNISLPTTISMTNLYANAILGNVCSNEPDILPLFLNADLAYRMIGNDKSLMAEFNYLPTSLSFLSDPFEPTSRFFINTYQRGFTFIHALNETPFSMNQINAPTDWFELSTIQEKAKIGYDGISNYCGTIFDMRIDPYSRIRPD